MMKKDSRYEAVKGFWGVVECGNCKREYKKTAKSGFRLRPMPMWFCSKECHDETIARVY
jgi:hypothetical protein